jgi:hypothetical protein
MTVLENERLGGEDRGAVGTGLETWEGGSGNAIGGGGFGGGRCSWTTESCRSCAQGPSVTSGFCRDRLEEGSILCFRFKAKARGKEGVG